MSAFLLCRLPAAYSASLEALELLARVNEYKKFRILERAEQSKDQTFFTLRRRLWLLNIAIFGAMLADRIEENMTEISPQSGLGIQKKTAYYKECPQHLICDLWVRVLKGYNSVRSNIDGQVIVVLVLLCINQRLLELAKEITEAYLSELPLIILSPTCMASSDKDSAIIQYGRLAEIYVLQVLVQLRQWDQARHFICFNNILSEQSKESPINFDNNTIFTKTDSCSSGFCII
ncbi:hypothetical protein FBU30_007481 [Linnemannia zychae]|nr:hypothetical protein FBU30_007481 [Linnemannia zychae]